MLLGVFIAMAVAAYFGAPLLPIVLVGAIMQAGVAFILTRSRACIRLGLGVALVAVAQYLLQPLLADLADPSSGELPVSPVVFEGLAYATAMICLVGCTIVGVIGRRAKSPAGTAGQV